MNRRCSFRRSEIAVALGMLVVAAGCGGTAVSPSPVAAPASSPDGASVLPSSPPALEATTTPSGSEPTPDATWTSSPPISLQSARWEKAGKLHWARQAPIAVVLGDGRVLVFGDEGGKYEPAPAHSRFAELWDPASGSWTKTDALPSPRGSAAVVTLQDGRAFVIGGLNDRWESYSSTYLFDPRTERWTKTGLLHTARTNPAATVLPDGRVLVAGGGYWSGNRSGADQDRTVLAGYRLADTGPNADGRALATAELYDPATGTWSRTGSMRYARWAASAATLADGRVLVVGDGEPPEVFDPRTESFTMVYQPAFQPAALAASGVPAPIGEVAPGTVDEVVALPDGGVIALEVTSAYSSGDGYVTVSQAFRFEGEDDRWHPIGEPYAVVEDEEENTIATWGRGDYPMQFSVALNDGSVLSAGGDLYLGNGYWRGTRDAAILDPKGGTWSTLPNMPGSRIDAAVVALPDGSALVIGGYDDPSDGYPVALADTFRFVPGA